MKCKQFEKPEQKLENYDDTLYLIKMCITNMKEISWHLESGY